MTDKQKSKHVVCQMLISTMEKNFVALGCGLFLFCYVLREGLPDKVSYKQAPKGSEGTSHANIWEKIIPGREKSTCKGPETEVCGYVLGTTRWICHVSRVGKRQNSRR